MAAPPVRWLTLISLFNLLYFIEAGLFKDAYNFYADTKGVIKEVGKGIANVLRGLETAGGVFNDATEEHCVYTCPNDSKPKTNKNYTPTSNGCGSFGLKIPDDILPVADLSKCCDKHDICYGTCNEKRDDCDKDFRSCLYKICDKYKAKIGMEMVKVCKAAAQTMYTGTIALGCKAYKDAQALACTCKQTKGHTTGDL